MADRTLTDLTYTREGIPTRGRCTQCSQLFSTPPEARATPEQATRDFYAAFAAHQCLAVNLSRSLVILKHKDKVPIVASCSACHRKFLTVVAFLHDQRAAEQYLLERFDLHKCSGNVSRSGTMN
jgi:hypothetical protein